MCCVPHVAHITVSEMVHDLLPPPPPSFPPSFPPHHFIHLALWGRLQAPVEVCVDARCNPSLRGPSTGRRQTALAGLRLSSPRCSSCINICPQLGRTQKGFYSFQSGGELLLWFVFLYGKEWVHSCLKTMMHCSMERLCSCGHSSVQEQLWFMVILHTFWPDYCNAENSYWFNNLEYLFLPSYRQDSAVGR